MTQNDFQKLIDSGQAQRIDYDVWYYHDDYYNGLGEMLNQSAIMIESDFNNYDI